MNLVGIVGGIAAIIIIILLIVLLVKLSGLEAAVAASKSDRSGPARAADGSEMAVVMELAKRVGDLQTKFGEIGNKLSSLNLQFSKISDDNQTIVQFLTNLHAANAAGTLAPQVAAPTLTVRSDRDAAEAHRTDIAESALAPPSVPEIDEPNVAFDAPNDRREAILEAYRGLIAQPRKSDINRWAEEFGGIVCEVTDDAAFQVTSREAGGLLVLVPVNDDEAIVVPSGRLVVDFATSYANVIAMRSVTKNSFELTQDGTGVLRLIEPAVAERSGDTWRLAQAGVVSGLKPD